MIYSVLTRLNRPMVRVITIWHPAPAWVTLSVFKATHLPPSTVRGNGSRSWWSFSSRAISTVTSVSRPTDCSEFIPGV